jgi:hypothetical protein
VDVVLLEEKLASANQVAEIFTSNPRWNRPPEGRVPHARRVHIKRQRLTQARVRGGSCVPYLISEKVFMLLLTTTRAKGKGQKKAKEGKGEKLECGICKEHWPKEHFLALRSTPKEALMGHSGIN